MDVVRSPEIEAVARRLWMSYDGPFDALRNLISSREELRVLGFDGDEWWHGRDEFLKVREAQHVEAPDVQLRIGDVEGFEAGDIGWATVFSTLTTPEGESQVRSTGVFGLEAGIWKALSWHNSIPAANEVVFGIAFPRTLNDLVDSVLRNEGSPIGEAETGGISTLVFTDVVDSTALAESIGDKAWTRAITDHEAAIRTATEMHGGRVIKLLGDGSMLAFESADAAVQAAVTIQRSTSDQAFDVRVGIHTGQVLSTQGDLFGLTVNKAARIAAAAAPGEVVISSTTRDLIGASHNLEFGRPRMVALKGLKGTHQIVPVSELTTPA